MKIVLLLVSILLLSSCDVLQPEETPTAKKRRKLFQTLWYPYIFTNTEYTYNQTITDNKDGTLTFINIEYETKFGTRETGRIEILFQRCLMGQVFRSAQNDCQGVGTKATVWNAQKYQWCPTNDRSCEDSNGNAISPASPAAKACADSNLQGKKWELVYDKDVYFKYQHNYDFTYTSFSKVLSEKNNSLFQDYISSDTTIRYIVWRKNSYSNEAAWVESDSSAGTLEKKQYYYSLCKEQK